MKRFLEELRSAKRIELFIAIAAIAMLILSLCGDAGKTGAHFTDEEVRLSEILGRIEGVGRIEVLISEENSGGVLIVAEGVENMETYLRLQYAVQTLVGTEISRIEIIPYGK